MAPRAQLQQLLEAICPNVYFQPPANIQMEYPAIVYRREPGDVEFANNDRYRSVKQYELTLISRNPDEPIFEELSALPLISHDRVFVADNLHHDVFSIYF
jgi:hypothetical protein